MGRVAAGRGAQRQVGSGNDIRRCIPGDHELPTSTLDAELDEIVGILGEVLGQASQQMLIGGDRQGLPSTDERQLHHAEALRTHLPRVRAFRCGQVDPVRRRFRNPGQSALRDGLAGCSGCAAMPVEAR